MKQDRYKANYAHGTYSKNTESQFNEENSERSREKQTHYTSVQFSSVAQSGLTLCNPMNHRTPGLPVHHQLPESTQTHVH